ncbi:LuxR C-terminal-related transcriptional regulator [Sphaerisporangium sp. NPDC049002]|uniref:helix-turn-helix transcriptional regulator n=1 Tax=unclassified Sphaerisporangium TaxID=2630420 RepID=UPI0033EF7078
MWLGGDVRDERLTGGGSGTPPRLLWPFVGRTAETLAVVRQLGAQGVPGVLLVGQAGVGKSRLLDSIVARCRDEGMHVVAVAGAEASSGLPFAAVNALLPDGENHSTANIFGAARSALLEAAGGRACVLAIDDAHHLDEASVVLVQHLAATAGVRILAAARTGTLRTPAVLGLLRRPYVQTFAVQALGREAVTALLGEALEGPVDGLTVDKLWRATQGNPLFLRHLLEACLASGGLRRVSAVWRWEGRMPAHGGLRDLVAALLDGLTSEEAHALSCVAHAEPVPLEVVETLVGTAVLEELERRSLIAVERVRRDLVVRVGHPLYGEVVRAETGEDRRRDIYRSLARAVTRWEGTPGDAEARAVASRQGGDAVSSPPGTSGDMGLRAVTWRLAAGDPVPDQEVLAAARDALARRDAPLSERLARRASPEAASDALARALVAQDKAAEADDLLARRMAEGEEVDAPGERARVAALRALNLFWNLRRPAEAQAVVRQARTLGPLDGPAGAELRVAELALDTFGANGNQRAPTGLSELSSRVGDPVIASVCEPLRAYLDLYLGRPSRVADDYATGRLGVPAVWGAMEAATTACGVQSLVLAGRLGEAFAAARSGYRTAVERAAPAEVTLLAFELGICETWAGRPARALPHFREARALLEDHIPFPIQVYVFAEYAACLASLGRAHEGGRVLGEITRRLPAESSLHDHLQMARIRISAHTGAWRAAASEAALLAHRYESAGWLTKASETLYYSARLRPSSRVAQALHDVAERGDSELFRLFARHARAASGADVEGLDAVSGALEHRGYTGVAAEAASTAAGVAEARGDARRAARLRTRHRRLVEQCEGYRPPWDRAVPAAVLSGREREACELAAAGLANDAIAARLGLSRRTVANHLHRAYGKLGVRGREELPDALGLPRPVTPVGPVWGRPG